MFEWEVIDVINNTLGIFIFVDKTQNTFIYERGFFWGGGGVLLGCIATNNGEAVIGS